MRSRPLPYSNPFVGRLGTGSLLCTITHPTTPNAQKQMDNRRPLLTVMRCRAGQTVLSQDRSMKAKMPIPLNIAKHFIHQFQQFVCVFMPGRVAQSVGRLTRKSGVLRSIPGLATYFRFSFRFFKKGSCQLLAKVCARSTG